MGADSWQTYKLGECVNFLSGGTPSKSNSAYWSGNIPWVTCKDMKVTHLYDSQDHLTETGSVNGTRLVEPGTILIVVRGMILAQYFPIAMARRRVAFNQDLKALRCKPNVEPQFLFYWLQGKSYEILGLVDEAAHGTKRLQTDRLQNFPLHLPSLPTQRKIAAIFSAYNDLIENNTRRIKILEEMARSLYREWFVNFRFPGYEQVKMVDSELGLIPEDWQIKTFSEVADFVNGFAFKPHHWGNLGKPIVKIVELKNGVIEKTPFYNGQDIPAKHYIKNGDVLFSWSADLDAYIWDNGEAFLNQHIFKVLPHEGYKKLFIFFSLKEHMQKFRNISQGTTMKHIKRAALNQVKLTVPLLEQSDLFEFNVEPMFQKILNLKSKNINLRRTRDFLLPKLISGEIDVEKLTINTGEIAA